MDLSAEQRELLPSDEDVAFYREHGWYISKKILSDEAIDDALYGSERHYAGERDSELLVGGYLDWKPGDGDALRINDYVSLQNDQLRNLVHTPLIAAVAARLSGSSTIRLFHDQLIYKPSGEKKAAIGWHVDRAYWSTCTSDEMLTAWIPFHDCDERMGTVTMLDGSHRWTDTADLRTFRRHDLDQLEQQFSSSGNAIRKVPMNLKKGQVSFHHARTIHGSYPNVSNAPRIALAVHLQDAANQYCLHHDDQGNVSFHIIDSLCRKQPNGNPDYADPDICPMLWSEMISRSAS